MSRLFIVLFLLILSVGVGLKIAEDPGYVVLAYQKWTVEMPLWVAVLSVLGILFLTIFILHFLRVIDASWHTFKNRNYRKQARFAMSLMQAHMVLEQGQFEQALVILNQLRYRAPRHILVLKLLERIYIHLEDWKNLSSLAPALYKARVITADQQEMLLAKVYQEQLKTAGESKDIEKLQKTWRTFPRKFQKRGDMVYAYVQQLSLYSDTLSEIEPLIIQTLKKEWTAPLAILYGTLPSQDASKQLKIAETWVKRYSEHGALYLTLARLSMRCLLWGKARSYYERNLTLSPTAAAFREYGDLLLQLDEMPGAIKSYQQGLEKLPVLPATGL